MKLGGIENHHSVFADILVMRIVGVSVESDENVDIVPGGKHRLNRDTGLGPSGTA